MRYVLCVHEGSGQALDLGIPGLTDAVLIGSGGSSKVYRATQAHLGRPVAVKVLLGTAPAEQKQFDRESKALGRLATHPGIVAVYDAGFTAQGDPYLLLEYCTGGSLADQLTNGVLSWPQAAAYLAPVAETLAHAHAQDFVHRDLKPGNILLNEHGHPLIADFGLARVISADASIGPPSIAAFTPGYVPPETVNGQPASPASDVYSLGGTLFNLVTGAMPFVDTDSRLNLVALARRISDEPVPDLRPQGIPDAVCRVIEAAMAKDPAARPTASEMAKQLATLAQAPTGTDAATPVIDQIAAAMSAPGQPRDQTIHLSPEQMATPVPATEPGPAPAVAQPQARPSAPAAVAVAPTDTQRSVPVKAGGGSKRLRRSRAILQGVLVGIAILGLMLLGVVAYFLITGEELPEITFTTGSLVAAISPLTP